MPFGFGCIRLKSEIKYLIPYYLPLFMCGIFGITGSFNRSLLSRAQEILAHRGPDGAGIFHDSVSKIGLVHTRLSILDATNCAAQPMSDVNNQITLIFNGEIYNYKDLRSQLTQDYTFRSSGDTEVLVAGYLKWGKKLLPMLNGIFALAIYDHRDKSLLIARDGFGTKPLYYTKTSEHFAFASEIKALLHVPGLDKTIDYQAISQYLSYLYSPGEATPFRSVRKLKPGHAMLLSGGKVDKVWKFYELPYDQPIQPYKVEEAITELRQRLDTAVDRQMVSDVPLGAFLSGGLDSSSLCAYAKKHSPDGKIDCFTIDFLRKGTSSEGFQHDLPFAQKVAKYLDLKLHTVTVTPESSFNLEKLVWNLDEPQANPSALNTYIICEAARSHGIKVLLSGTGGDDIFTGYRRHRALDSEKYWSWLPLAMRQTLAGISSLAPRNKPWGRRLSKAFRQAASSPQDRLIGYFQWISTENLNSLWSSDIRSQGLIDPSLPFIDALNGLPSDILELNKMLFLEGKFYLCDECLNYTDKMSMAAGVEVRVPFLDNDLVSFAARLPLNFKQHGAEGKWILKKAMEGMLPNDIIYRSKTGFGVPLREWMSSQIDRIMGDYLSPETLKRRGIFDPVAVGQLIADDKAGRVDASYSILALACVEVWCRQFADSTQV